MLLGLRFPNLARMMRATQAAQGAMRKTMPDLLRGIVKVSERELAADMRALMKSTSTAAKAGKADQILAGAAGGGQDLRDVTRRLGRVAKDLGGLLPGGQAGIQAFGMIRAQQRKQDAMLRLANRIARLEGNKKAAAVYGEKLAQWRALKAQGQVPVKTVSAFYPSGKVVERRIAQGRPTRVLWDEKQEARLKRSRQAFLRMRAKAREFNVQFQVAGTTFRAKYGPKLVNGWVQRGPNQWTVKLVGRKWAGCPQGLARMAGRRMMRRLARGRLAGVMVQHLMRAAR